MNTSSFIRATGALALSSMLALTGCASMGTATNSVTQKVGGIFGSKNDTTKAATGGAILGGAIGCAGGAVLARVIGGGHDMLKGCAAGAAAGAVVGGVVSVQVHKHELAKAKALADEANAAGLKSEVAVRQVEAKDDAGKPVQTEALDQLAIDLPAAKVKAHSPDVVRVIGKASALADTASEPTTIRVEGTATQRAWIVGQVRQGLKAGSTVKVEEADAVAARLVISPVPAPAVAGSK